MSRDDLREVKDVISPGALVEMMLSRQAELDECLQGYRNALHVEATAEENYRILKKQKWQQTLRDYPDTKTHTAGFREAWVNGECAEKRRIRDDAVAESKAFAEEVRNLRQILSSLQTAQRMMSEELGAFSKGPELTP